MNDTSINLINEAFDNAESIKNPQVRENVSNEVNKVISSLNSGDIRVAEKVDGEWIVNQWVKKAVLLSFRLSSNTLMEGQLLNWYDKVPLKFSGASDKDFSENNIRVVPPATVRSGVYIGPNTVIMPSYINIGAYIDSGCMIDTWATVGSCAQIGKNVHISGGAGIGGVLEPLQANPTIIEDNCFIGARSEVVEGVVIERDSVISMGVFIGQSTRIYDRQKDEVSYGRIPAGSVVVPGNIPSKDNKYSLACAVIVKKVDQRTKEKVGINNILREAAIEA